ncbi:hypothetical protein LTR37_002460 [Vermiconidia calcicola]|uniref:Uncharacterized protein n=1 Tax=Vermiconidia calcicola TaxID=1690605 RepID=A0ACC3NTK8_9PEZI|nr:hypothetical protein LTR37_002460 [Vermiconidia calcicola]
MSTLALGGLLCLAALLYHQSLERIAAQERRILELQQQLAKAATDLQQSERQNKAKEADLQHSERLNKTKDADLLSLGAEYHQVNSANAAKIVSLRSKLDVHIQLARAANARRLPKLPPELRNTIYEMLVVDFLPYARIRAGGTLDRPALSAVCHQLREEVLAFDSFIIAQARTITAEVHNFDFSHVISFIHGLTWEQIYDIQVNQSLSIRLTIDKNAAAAQEDLKRWLHFCDDETVARPRHGQMYYFSGRSQRDMCFPLGDMRRSWDGEADEEVRMILQAWRAAGGVDVPGWEW